MDIALSLFSNAENNFYIDVSLDGPDLKTEKDLEASVLMSIFTDRRANNDDIVEGTDRRGWWADTFAEVKNDKIGSRLWLLQREKLTNLTVTRAHGYVVECLKWLLDDKVAQSVNVQTEIVSLGVLGIGVEIVKPNGTSKKFKYYYAWSQL